MKNMVYIYALCNVYYDSFYIEGIKEVFHAYKFNIDKFPTFKQGVFAVLIAEENLNIKVIIDSDDSDRYDQEALEWCDVYGKVNYNTKAVPEGFNAKIKPIGPSFGIKIWNFSATIFHSVFNYLKFKDSISNKREFLANYWRQYRRIPLSKYQSGSSLEKFTFFTASIWKNEVLTNEARAAFISSCKKNRNIVFEGGFAPRKDSNTFGYDDLIVSKRYHLKEYFDKIKRSTVTFNTPAVLSCHGWKLGEFLALGKAILTTNHINELPADLKDNVHVVYVDSLKKIDEKMNLIIDNVRFKKELEKNARNYFDLYLAPKVVIQRLLPTPTL